MRERFWITTKFSLIFLMKISTRNQLSDSRSWVLYCRFDWIQRNILNHFMPIVSFYTTLKTLGNLWFSDNFRRCRKRQVVWVGLIVLSWKYQWKKEMSLFLFSPLYVTFPRRKLAKCDISGVLYLIILRLMLIFLVTRNLSLTICKRCKFLSNCLLVCCS